MSLNIGGRSIAIGMGLMIVLTSATLIRANGDAFSMLNKL